jgi:SSS family solute:Na+ symporter
MKLNILDGSVFALYFGVVLALGVYAARQGKGTKRDYFLAGDKLTWWMVGGSIVAANISSHHLVGVMGTAYNRGFVAMVIEWGAILIGFNALLWVFLPFYLRNGFYTMPEFLQRRFGGAARTTYASLVMVIYLLVELAAVLYLGALALFSLTRIPLVYSIVLLAAATGVYTIAGGLRAVVWTEMLQLAVLLSGGLALSVVTVHKAGGWAAIAENSADWHMLLPASDPDFPWTMYLGGIVCISVAYCAANQFIVQRVLAAKDEWHARFGVVFTLYLKFLMPLIIVVPGLVAPRLFPNLEKPDLVFPTLVQNLLPPGIVGLVMAGLIAAVMSHISGAVNSCTTIATVDFYLPYIHRGASEAQAVRFGRWFGVGVLVMSVFLAETMIRHGQKPVFLYLFNAYGYVTPGIATMFLMGILWRRATQPGAMAAGLLTIPLSAVLEWLYPTMPFMNRTGIVFWSCLAVCVAVSLMTRPKPAEELAGLIWNRASLALPDELRQRMHGWANPLIWWAIVTALVLFFYIKYP